MGGMGMIISIRSSLRSIMSKNLLPLEGREATLSAQVIPVLAEAAVGLTGASRLDKATATATMDLVEPHTVMVGVSMA